jgi:hypothetical protein
MTDAGNVVYLNFQTKKNCINENNLLTQIHKYCVYQSLYRFGWLFLSSAYLPPKPLIPYNKKLFVSVLKKALNSTYNDLKRRLFESMLNIILENEDVGDLDNLSIGVNSFEGVWERMIDHVFGEENKEDYFPHGEWYILRNDHIEKSSALEPDTIMKYGGKIYVLDAKYYRFGLTGHAGDLPATSSIQKQITYGKYIAASKKEVSVNNVYNAFVMPAPQSRPAVANGVSYYAKVTMPLFGESEIVVLTLSPERLFACYADYVNSPYLRESILRAILVYSSVTL